MLQLSHPHMTTGKAIALTIQIFVSKVMSLLFNMLSRLVIAVLPRSKHLLTSWLHSPSVVILESKKIKSLTVSIVSPSICHDVMGPDAISQHLHCPLFTFIKRLFSSSSVITCSKMLFPIKIIEYLCFSNYISNGTVNYILSSLMPLINLI